jgi:U3 small nucleolar RNA-associated protein 12
MIERQSKERVGRLRFNASGELLACQSTDNSVELYTVATPQDIKTKLKKRKNKLKKKLAAAEGKDNEPKGIIMCVT